MTWTTAIAGAVLALGIPYVVALMARQNWSSTVKRCVAIAASCVAGVATAIITGTPTPETLVLYALAVIGGVQAAYSAFKAIGVTSSWLDALGAVGAPKDGKEGTD